MSADHAAEAGTAGPAAANLALEVQVTVFIADGNAAAAAVALVAGIERPGKAGRRGAGVRVRDANGLHWIRKKEEFKGGYEMCLENIFISIFLETVFRFLICLCRRRFVVPPLYLLRMSSTFTFLKISVSVDIA